MKISKCTSSSNVFKRATSTAILAAMIVPSTVQIAYAQDADESAPSEPSKNTQNQIQNNTTKHRDEAEAAYLKDLKASEDATVQLNQAQEMLDGAQASHDAAQVTYNQAYIDAESTFNDAKSKAEKNLHAAQVNHKQTLLESSQKAKDIEKAELERSQTIAALHDMEDAYSELFESYNEQGKIFDKLIGSEHQVFDAKQDLNAQKAKVQKLQDAYNQAREKYEQSQNTVDQSALNLKQLKEKLADAQSEKDRAQRELERAEKAYDQSFSQSDVQKLNEARDNFKLAKQAHDEAQDALRLAVESYSDSEIAFNEAKQIEQSAESKVDKARDALHKTKKSIEDLSTSIFNQEKALASLETRLKDTKSVWDKFSSEYSDTQKLLTEKQSEVNRLQEQKDSLQKSFDEAKAQVEDDSLAEQFNEGAFNFFKVLADEGSDDAKQALYILEHSDLHSFVQKGNPLSATSYDNILKALDYIDASNEIRMRPENALQALKVSHSTMAMAMVNADWSTQNIKHSYQHFGAYYNGENAAWGMNNPFISWYDKEKAYYDKAIANGEFDPSDYESYKEWGEKPSSDPMARRAGKNNEMTVGHYTTLAEKTKTLSKGTYKPIHYVTTGYGYSQLPVSKKLGNFKPMTHVQDFASQYIVDGRGRVAHAIDHTQPQNMELFTTDEYRDLLRKWKDSLSADHIEDLEKLQNKLISANTKLAGAKADLAKQNSIVEERNKALKDLNVEIALLTERVSKDTQAYNKAKQNFSDSKVAYTKQEAVLDTLVSEYNQSFKDYYHAQEQFVQAQSKLENAKQKADKAAINFNQASEALDLLERDHQLSSDKAQQLAKAKEIAESKCNDAVAAWEQLTQSVAESEEKHTESERIMSQENKDMISAQALLVEAQKDLIINQHAYDNKLAKHETLSKQVKELNEAKDKIREARDTLSELIEKKTTAVAALKEAEKNVEAAELKLQQAELQQERLKDIRFDGLDTPQTNDVLLDEKIDALKKTHQKTTQASADYAHAQERLKVLQGNYKDALASLIQSKIELDSYTLRVVEGAMQKVAQGSEFAFRVDRDPHGFKGVLIDNKVVPEDAYSIRQGSTVVSFSKEYSASLGDGEHVFKAVYDNGAYAESIFSVMLPENSDTAATETTPYSPEVMRHGSSRTPQTSDAGQLGSVLTAISGLVSLGACMIYKKNDNE